MVGFAFDGFGVTKDKFAVIFDMLARSRCFEDLNMFELVVFIKSIGLIFFIY